jgi:hypothetical protein
MAFTLKRCDAEVSPKCPGHSPVGKFPDCLIEALYGGSFDEETGTVDGFNRWVGLIIQAEAETVDMDTVAEIPVTIPAGTFLIITENDQGHIGVETYPNAEEAQSAFDEWERLYGLWCEAEEAREAEIMTSSGRIGR